MDSVFSLVSLKVALGQGTSPSSGNILLSPCRKSIKWTHSQWYLPHEMALRMSIYNIAQPVGAMLSGALQGALSTNLDGALGRSGWRWAFLINVRYFSALHDYVLTNNIGRLHNFHRIDRLFPFAWLCKSRNPCKPYLVILITSSLARAPESAVQGLPTTSTYW